MSLKHIIILGTVVLLVQCANSKRKVKIKEAVQGDVISNDTVTNYEVEKIIKSSVHSGLNLLPKFQREAVASYYQILAEDQHAVARYDYAAGLYEKAFEYVNNDYYSAKHLEELVRAREFQKASKVSKKYILMFPRDKKLLELRARIQQKKPFKDTQKQKPLTERML